MDQSTESMEVCKKARSLLRAKKYDEAAAVCETALKQDDDDPDVHETLATVKFLGGDCEAAIAHLTRVTRLAPRRASAFVNMGAVYNRMGDFDKAVEALRRGLQIDKKSSEGYYNLGIAYRKLKQWNMAVPAYREAIRLAPEMYEAYQNLGNVYSEMGNHQQAAAQYKKSLEIKPDFERAQLSLERVQKIIAEEKQAANPFGRLVEAPPDQEAAAAAIEPTRRELTDPERVTDRRVVHQLLKSAKGDVQHLLDALKSDLEPSIRELSMSFAQADSSASLAVALGKFRAAKLKYAPLLQRFNSTVQSLRDHEAGMQ